MSPSSTPDDTGGYAGYRAMQRYFARDPVSWAARAYLGVERTSIN